MSTLHLSSNWVAAIVGGPVGLSHRALTRRGLAGKILAVAVLAAVACLAVAGCAGTPTSVPPDAGEPERETEATGTYAASPPLPTLGAVSGTREHRVTWRILGVQDSAADQVVVEVDVGGPPCDVVTEVAVTESDSTVELTVWAGAQEGTTEDCATAPLTLGTHALVVPLGRPLAERVVLDPR